MPQHRIATAISSEQTFIYIRQPNNEGAPDQMLWVHYGQIYVCQKLIGAPDLMLWVFHNSTCADWRNSEKCKKAAISCRAMFFVRLDCATAPHSNSHLQ